MMIEEGSQVFQRGEWTVELTESGKVYLHSPRGGARWVMLEVEAFDLRRALGDALDVIQRKHGRTLAEVESAITRGTGG